MGNSNKRNYDRVTLDYGEVKEKFKWISTIGPARDKMTGSRCTIRVTFNRTSSRIRDFDNQRLAFESFIHDFYAQRHMKASTVWEKNKAIVAVF